MSKFKAFPPAKFVMDEPYAGAHVRIKMGDFYHHGIYVGDGMVVEFGSARDMYGDPSKVVVQLVSADAFVCGEFLEVRQFCHVEKKRKRKDSEIVAVAKSHIGEGGYSILSNNCEHFANLCVFGEKFSEQVADARQAIRNILKGREQ